MKNSVLTPYTHSRLGYKRQQSGYIVFMVAAFLVVLMTASAKFFDRATDSTAIAGTVRDNTEALLLAESAMNMLTGQFANALDSDGDGTTDKTTAGQLQENMTDPESSLLPYMFFVTGGNGLDQTSPSLLQKIADGESKQTGLSALTGQQVNATTSEIRVEALFVDTARRPKLYKMNDNGLLIESAATIWSDETEPVKAAAWVEVTQNPTLPAAVDLFAQSVATVGNTTSYLQRFIGSYFANTTLGNIPILTEASNIDRN